MSKDVKNGYLSYACTLLPGYFPYVAFPGCVRGLRLRIAFTGCVHGLQRALATLKSTVWEGSIPSQPSGRSLINPFSFYSPHCTQPSKLCALPNPRCQVISRRSAPRSRFASFPYCDHDKKNSASQSTQGPVSRPFARRSPRTQNPCGTRVGRSPKQKPPCDRRTGVICR
jgi:hypothetical protein